MNDFNGLYKIRLGKEEDKNFILSTFLRGLYFGSIDKENPNNTLFFGLIPKKIFFDRYKLVAQALVSDKNTCINVACLSDDEDTILGYSITNSTDTTLYWVFVKERWRKHGVARSLIPESVNCIAHMNLLGKSLMHKISNVTFNPFF